MDPQGVNFTLRVQTTELAFADARVTLPVGRLQLAAQVFRQDPPTPGELEHAIDLVEDALTASRVPREERGALVTDDAWLRALPGLATPAGLSLEAVEALFQRLASRSLGTPVPATDVPEGRETAASLLILREVMHHLGFARVVARGRVLTVLPRN